MTIKHIIGLTVLVAICLGTCRQAYYAGWDKGYAQGQRQEARDQNYMFGWRLNDRLERLEARMEALAPEGC